RASRPPLELVEHQEAATVARHCSRFHKSGAKFVHKVPDGDSLVPVQTVPQAASGNEVVAVLLPRYAVGPDELYCLEGKLCRAEGEGVGYVCIGVVVRPGCLLLTCRRVARSRSAIRLLRRLK